MLPAEKEVRTALKSMGAVLVRVSNHQVWKLPNGLMHITPKPGQGCDPRAWKNNLAALRKRIAGILPTR